ncbi:MAG: 50S ribosomal protein L30 [Methanomassiliicoccales archaeon]|nr:MAG: 50S ribosomal protein L30 [Methanomassiliicoccales archaeon]
MTYAVIRVRGSVNVTSEIKDTLNMLRLNRVNHCVILPETKSYLGMLQKVKDYVTWGEIKPETLAKLLIRRGKRVGNNKITDSFIKKNTKYKSVMSFAKAISKGEAKFKDLKDLKATIRLHPPRKGYEGVKRSYKAGGALGYRGADINALIERMV